MKSKFLHTDPAPARVLKETLVPLVALYAFALGLRLIRLFDLDLNFDESALLLRSQDSFIDIWNNCKTDNYGPLYPWLVKLWNSLGSGYDWFRLLAGLTGALVAPAAFLLGREIKDKSLGWLLGIACSLSVSLVFFSQFTRMFNLHAVCACLSVYWFLRALKANQSRDWLLMGIANLVGFYLFMMMPLLAAAQFLVLIFHLRADWKGYARPLLCQLPYVLGVLLWLAPALQRYAAVKSDFWTWPLSWRDFVRIWFGLGSGTNFRETYPLAGLVNLPFILGCVWAVFLRPRERALNVIAFLLVFVVAVIGALSFAGQSLVHIRYVLFVLPLYLVLAVAGWMKMKKAAWKNAGLVFLLATLACSLIYYYVDYYWEHDYFFFARPLPLAESGEGHALSRTAADLARLVKDDEAIIHFCYVKYRTNSFFASVIYHRRAFREFVYDRCRDGINSHNGLQYVQPGEVIYSLSDIRPLPAGIWLVVLGFTENILGDHPPRWVRDENLPAEIRAAGFQRQEMFYHGNVTAIHFRRSVEDAATPIQ